MIEKNKKTLTFTLTEKQKEFYSAFFSKTIKEILVGGGARGGKTRGVIEIIIATCISYAGIVWLIGRNELDDLRKTTLQTLLKALKEKGLEEKKHYKINYQSKELIFLNGSKIIFVPLKQQPSDPEFNWLGGYEITFFFIDEAQEVSKKCLSILKSRCTEKIKEYNLTGKGFLGCNPMKGWLYDRYIKPFNEGKLKKELKFIPSLYKDNPFLNHEEYEKSLADADEVTKQRLLYGNWEYDDTPGKLYFYDDILALRNKEKVTKNKDEEYYISIDGATEGKDKAVLLLRKGLKIIHAKIWDKCTTKEIEVYATELIEKYKIKQKNVVNDHVGVGAGISYGIGNQVFKFNSNSSELKKKEKDPQLYNRLRDQVYFKLKEHIKEIVIETIELDEYKERIVRELDVIAQIEIDKGGPLKIIKKENIKKLIGHSPDFADSIAMRMVYECNRKKRLTFY